MAEQPHRRLYIPRRVWLVGGLIAPVVVLGAAWLVVNEWVLAPAVPDASTPPDELVAFIVHEKGLPRLRVAEAERVMQAQLARLAADERLREQFLRHARILGPDGQEAFRQHLFDLVLRMVLADVEAYEKATGPARAELVDACIVQYNRMGRGLEANKSSIDSDVAKSLLGSEKDLLQRALGSTSAEEQQRLLSYFGALQSRVAEILADEELTAEFEARIAAGGG